MRNYIGVLTVGLMCGGCEAPTDVLDDADAFMVTDRAEYVLELDRGGLWAEIRITYSNRTDDPILLSNCNGQVSPTLQRSEAGSWVHVWTPLGALCRTEPIAILAGTQFRATFRLRGAEDAQRATAGDIDGVYRLFWNRAYREGDNTLPDAYKTSNTFRFGVPANPGTV